MDGEILNGDHQSSGGSPTAEKAELATSVIKAVRTFAFFLCAEVYDFNHCMEPRCFALCFFRPHLVCS